MDTFDRMNYFCKQSQCIQIQFCELPNFIGSPHNSAMVPGMIKRAVELAALNIRNFIQDKPIAG